MRLGRLSLAGRLALALASSPLVFSGCVSSFANADGYDEQACVERALRRATDADTVARANREFTEECRQGGAEACSALGVMNEMGVGVPKNVPAAIALYERACHRGNAHACGNLGIARAEGLDGPADPQAVARLLEAACDGADARACAYLARMHMKGEGVVTQPRQAERLLERACNGEEAVACLALGDILAEQKESARAAEFYGKGCLHGEPAACAHLGP